MSSKITVTYFPEHTVFGTNYSPKIPVWISTGNKHSFIFHALVDSGADVNLFPAEHAEAVGINVKSGLLVKTGGIGGVIKAYRHNVNIHIGKKIFKTVADFTYEFPVALLGRQGFFNLFKRIDFDENKHKVTLHVK